ncbi:hypothetical protein OC844_002524 [Tilletia horrida]|nr:hypothetical protein OC844_002524 [Tilletia horrida]
MDKHQHLPILPAELLRSIFSYAAHNVRAIHFRYAQHHSEESHTASVSPSPSASSATKRRRKNSTLRSSPIADLLCVSRAVHGWVLAELLRTVALTSPAAIIAFGTSLQTRPSLGMYVRRLWIETSGLSTRAGTAHAGEELQQIFALESYILPRLRKLDDLALSNLAPDHLRAHAHPLWFLGATRSEPEWASLRSLTVANMRGLAGLLQPPPPSSKGGTRFAQLRTLRIALPEELSRTRIDALRLCPRLTMLELVEPGLDTLVEADLRTGGVVAGGIGDQAFGSLRGLRDAGAMDRASVEALFAVLVRSDGDGDQDEGRGRGRRCGGWGRSGARVHVRVLTRTPAAYAALRVAWDELSRDLDGDQQDGPGSKELPPILQIVQLGAGAGAGAGSKQAAGDWQTLLLHAPGGSRSHSIADSPQDTLRHASTTSAAGGGAVEEEDAARELVPLAKAGAWKQDLRSFLLQDWSS